MAFLPSGESQLIVWSRSMKRWQVLSVGGDLAVLSRRPLAVLMTGLLALVWLSSAMAEQAENPSLVPEGPAAVPGGEWTRGSPAWLTPELPKKPKRAVVTVQQEDDGNLPANPDPPRKPKRAVVTVRQADDESLPADPEPPRNPQRPAMARPIARRQEIDAGPPTDHEYMVPGPYAEEDVDACEDRGPCPNRIWRSGSCWQPFANRLEARGEYLLWWGKGNYVPALVTTGPSAPANGGQPGAFGSTGTAVLFGDSYVNDAAQSGAASRWITG